MKYIFYSRNNNAKLRNDIIIKSNLKLEVDLFGEKKDDSELYIIYDSDTNKISLFNNISKDRKIYYRYIDISYNSSILFPLILGQINEKFIIVGEMSSDLFIIRSLSLKSKTNIFESLFENNNFSNPLVFSSFILDASTVEELFLSKNSSFKNNINFTISSLHFNKRNGLYNGDELIGTSCSYYNISNENELLGCEFDEFFNGLKSLDITNDLNKHFGNKGKLLNVILHPECNYSNEKFTLRKNDGDDSFKIISIRNKKDIINLRYCDFIDSIDVSPIILYNLISNGVFINEVSENQVFIENNRSVIAINEENTNIIYLPNIFNFKYSAYNLYTYEYSNDAYSNRL